MKVNIISINPVTNIPSLRYFIDYFIKKKSAKVELTEVHVKSFNSYYNNIPTITFNNIATFKTHKEYVNKRHTLKAIKYKKVIQKIISSFREKNDIIITTDFQVLFFIFLLKPFFKKSTTKIIYQEFELVEEEFLEKMNLFFYKKILKKAHLIDLAIFPEVNRLNFFLNKSTLKKEQSLMIPNTCSVAKLQTEKHSIFNTFPKESIIIGHIGNVGGKEHYFENLIKIATQLKSNPNVFFLFIGYQSDEIKNRIKKLELNNLFFLDAVPHEELDQIYSHIDLGLILYRGVSPNFEMCAPNKLYEYWSYGVPVIAHQLTGLKPVFKIGEQGQLIDFENLEKAEETMRKIINKELNRDNLQTYFKDKLDISKFMLQFELKLNSI